jgi:hypothetical protein
MRDLAAEQAVEHGVRTRWQNTDFRSATGAEKLRQVPGNARGSAGNQPEHPLAYHGSGKILEEARGNGYITRRRVPYLDQRVLPGRKFPLEGMALR